MLQERATAKFFYALSIQVAAPCFTIGRSIFSLCSKWKPNLISGCMMARWPMALLLFLGCAANRFCQRWWSWHPATANGLKVCFDTYNNCTTPSTLNVPKIELRWVWVMVALAQKAVSAVVSQHVITPTESFPLFVPATITRKKLNTKMAK